MAIDLHTHSTYSDGSDAPARVIELAIGAGLGAVALTDHDTIEGLEAAAAAASGRIEFVPGIELSVDWNRRSVHLLVYWVEEGTPLVDALIDLQAGRAARNAAMVAALADLGIDITAEEVAAEAGHGVAGRPHIAAVLRRKGVVESIPQGFAEYLAEGRPAFRERVRLDLSDAVSLTRRSSAVPVVAHPHTIADDEAGFRGLFARLADAGVVGVECHYAEYPPEMRQRLAADTTGLGLIATGGSDYHGTYKDGITVGAGRGDLVVPDECLEALRAAGGR
jgi:3',5'-nucleoside bisphosphate phosphatase